MRLWPRQKFEKKTMLQPQEFRDPMMEELHEIRHAIAERYKHLSPSEKVARMHQEVTAFLDAQGYEIVPLEDGTGQIRKRSST